MARQVVFLALAVLAGLTVGVGVGYLANIGQVNALTSENLYLQQQLAITQNNLTAYDEAYRALQDLYDNTRMSYQGLSLQYSNLLSDYNLARHNINTLNDTLAELTGRYNALQLLNQYLLLQCYNATFLPDGAYHAQALSELGSASSSIYVAMYDMKYDPGDSNDTANDLIAALAAAKDRGVDVRIVLDEHTLEEYPETIAFLQNSSVPFRLDPSNSTTTHAKLVLVDGDTVFIGSENWTESGLSYNNEFAVMLRGNMAVVTGYFLDLWDNGRAL